MNGDAKVWSVIGLLLVLLGASYYGTYQLGKRAELRSLAAQLREMTEDTYGDGYSDGKKQAQFDCVNGLYHG